MGQSSHVSFLSDNTMSQLKITLGPVLFVVQVMSDISKQDCIHNKRIPQSTKMKICIHHQ